MINESEKKYLLVFAHFFQMSRQECKKFEVEQLIQLGQDIPWLHQVLNKPKSLKTPYWARGLSRTFWKNVHDRSRLHNVKVYNGINHGPTTMEQFDPRKVMLSDIKSKDGYKYCDVEYGQKNNPLVLLMENCTTKIEGQFNISEKLSVVLNLHNNAIAKHFFKFKN